MQEETREESALATPDESQEAAVLTTAGEALADVRTSVPIGEKWRETYELQRARAEDKNLEAQKRRVVCVVCQLGVGTLVNLRVAETNERGKTRIVKRKVHESCKQFTAAGALG